MTEEQINSFLSILERIATAIEASTGARSKPSGGPDRPFNRAAMNELIDIKSAEKVAIFADAMIEQLNTPGGSTKERWEKARLALINNI